VLRCCLNLFRRGLALICITAGFAFAVDPHIDRIELLSTNMVTIHFDTEPNRAYTLQYREALPCGRNLALCAATVAFWAGPI